MSAIPRAIITFFEMLGNFSFGDYFKERAIELAWNLLTREWGLAAGPADRHRLSYRRRGLGPVEEDRRPARRAHHPHPDQGQFLGDGRQTARAGPARRSSTIMAIISPAARPGRPDEDGDRFVEIWNLVFMQYEQEDNEIVRDLPKPVDRHRHGAGADRRGAAGRPRQLRHRHLQGADRAPRPS